MFVDNTRSQISAKLLGSDKTCREVRRWKLFISHAYKARLKRVQTEKKYVINLEEDDSTMKT